MQLSKSEIDNLTRSQIEAIYDSRTADVGFVAPDGTNIKGFFVEASADFIPIAFDIGPSAGVTYFVGFVPGTDQVFRATAVNLGFDLGVSPGPITPTVGVFAFTGGVSDFGGGSFAASLRSGVAAGVGYSPGWCWLQSR